MTRTDVPRAFASAPITHERLAMRRRAI